MKRYAIGLALILGLVACTGEITEGDDLSPDDPASFDHAMFDQNALAGFDLEDRAYVQGHAIGVYLYGKTLPGYVGHRYAYEPGFSAGEARVRYGWDAVMVARSGGVDGEGNMVFSEHDTECPPDDDTEPPPDGDTEPPPDGDTEPPPGDDDVGTPGDTEPPPDDGGGDDECPPPDDDYPTDDCEDFLDPAAMDARELAVMVDAITVLGPDYPADSAYVTAFERGLAESLYLQDLHENTDHSEIEMLKSDVQDDGLCEHSPLVLDLAGDGFELAPVKAGIEFDLRGNGTPVVTAWPQNDDALLALDWNDNGRIDDGSELFGNSRRHSNGFAALAELDDSANGGNRDGVIDASDALFPRLQLWRDDNRDGVSDASELVSAGEAGLVQIDLSYDELNVRDATRSLHKQAASFVWRTDEQTYRTGSIVDIWFRYRRR